MSLLGLFNPQQVMQLTYEADKALHLHSAGGVTPRRITSVGYCVGGSVASLAAVFAALQCPTADVRCITFGSQLVGNAAFANAFRCAKETPQAFSLLRLHIVSALSAGPSCAPLTCVTSCMCHVKV